MSTTTTVTNYNDRFVLYRNTNPQCSLALVLLFATVL